MNNNRKNILNISYIAVLISIVCILQVTANYVTLGPVSINLSLAIIAIAGIACGPIGGLIVGMFSGVIVIFAPSTQSLFFVNHPLFTSLLCIFKTGLAGLASGILYRAFKNKKIGVFVSGITVPIVNTLLFSLATIFVFVDIFPNDVFDFRYFLLTIIGWNFLIEFAVNAFLTNSLYYITEYVAKRK